MPTKHVPRPRLVAALDRAVERPLTLIAAGAASGKTVLLNEWCRTRSRRAAWVSLDREDNERPVFWSLVHDALIQAELIVPTEPGLPLRSISEETMEELARVASEGADPTVLVLDDAHVLSDPDLLSTIDVMLRHPMPGLRIVMSARSDPLVVPLHRYRIRDELSELRAADLAMTSSELDDLLAVHHVTIEPRHKALLEARTEGWVASLRLSALRMEGSDEPGRFVTEFAMDRGSTGEFLMEEVLAALDGPTRRLLIRTSTCEAICGPLADEICGSTGGSAILARLAANNSFVVNVDHEGVWFRYHTLLREVLTHLLHREAPSFQRSIEARAARWHAANGNLGRALVHALKAEDWGSCTDLLGRGAFEQLFLRQGERSGGDLSPYLTAGSTPIEVTSTGESAAVDAQREARLRLVATQAAVAAATDRFTEAQQLVDSLGADTVESTYGVFHSYTRLVLAARAGDRSGLQASAADLLESDAAGPFGSWAMAQCGSAHLWLGRESTAIAQLLRALTQALELEMPAIALDAAGRLAIAHCSVGRVAAAEEFTLQARRMLQRHTRLALTPFAAAYYLGVAQIALARASFADYEPAMRFVEQTVSRERDPALSCAATLLRAKALQTIGHYDEARAEILGDPACSSPGAFNLRSVATMMLLELDAQAGRPQEALDSLSTTTGGRHPILAMMTEVALARAHLAGGDLQQASGLVRRVVTAAGPSAPLPVLLEALLVGSEVAMAQGDERRAVEDASRAIELGSGGEVLYPFMETAPRLGKLLSRHPGLVDRWPIPFEGDAFTHPGSAPPGGELPELLTDRELSVLRWLTTTMSTAEIADELCVSTNTIKTHLAAIYRKLGTAKRRDAVARGRELQLI